MQAASRAERISKEYPFHIGSAGCLSFPIGSWVFWGTDRPGDDWLVTVSLAGEFTPAPRLITLD